MRPTLFLKILSAFWLASVLATVGAVLIFAVRNHFGPDVFAELRAERIREASAALDYGGRPALERVVSAWPKEVQAGLRIGRAPDGRAIVSLEATPPPTGLLPVWPLATQFAASLLLSGLLAANLARPIRQLRDVFSKLAQGDLSVRLTPGMGRRRDEIAELAHDFDAMAERLEQLITSRDRLLHDVSHELRSPLARMSIAVGLIHKNGDRAEAALTRIETESARLNEIVGDLLSLSRAEGDVANEEIYFDLGGLMQAVVDDARFEAQPRGVAVLLELSPELQDPEHAPLLKGAPQLLRRGIENVVRNALRFSPAGEAVTVRATEHERRIVIDVTDKGPGVPAALIETMFEPFVKGAGETLGVGLGLTIARRALAAYGGTLQALNLPGGGFLMRLNLPVAG